MHEMARYKLGANAEISLLSDGNLSQLELYYGGDLQELVGIANTDYVRWRPPMWSALSTARRPMAPRCGMSSTPTATTTPTVRGTSSNCLPTVPLLGT